MSEGLYLRFLKLFSDNKYRQEVAQIGKSKITLEVADDSYKRAKGLMYRDKLHKDYGMLFVFSSEKRYSFWMLNMKFSIDLLWVDKNMNLVDVTRNAKPASSIFNAKGHAPAKPAMYVIETCSGFVDSSGVKPGDKISLKFR